LSKVPTDAAPALVAGLQGLLDGRQDKALVTGVEAMAVISKLAQSDNPAIASAAGQLQRHFTGQ
jgi:hypothetical protein